MSDFLSDLHIIDLYQYPISGFCIRRLGLIYSEIYFNSLFFNTLYYHKRARLLIISRKHWCTEVSLSSSGWNAVTN